MKWLPFVSCQGNKNQVQYLSEGEEIVGEAGA